MLNMIERTQDVMLKLELSNAKQMLDITKGAIAKKCFDCEEYIRDAVGNCITGNGQAEERIKQMQETLCARCSLYQYHLEYKGGKI